ncbi:MAG: hypothetical protein ACNS62_00090 [Candidatus Cyclobacteriaceae bacterium M3_2C_046]
MKRNTLIYTEEDIFIYSEIIDGSRRCYNTIVLFDFRDFSQPCAFSRNYLITRWRLEFLFKGRGN